ncbi:MAG TPA: hypothetical protein VIG75_10590, partial [Citricoccus sp.]
MSSEDTKIATTTGATTTAQDYAIVIPSLGRPSLDRLLETIAGLDTAPDAPGPVDVVVVDDRREPAPGDAPLTLLAPV